MINLIDGIELLGKMPDAGYRRDSFLIKTPDKQFIELTDILYHIVESLYQKKTEEQTVQYVNQFQQKEVDRYAIRFLIEKKLKPLGIVRDATKHISEIKHNRQTMLPGLRYRFTLLPEKVTEPIAHFFSPLFAPLIMIFVLLDFILLQIWLFGFHGVYGSLEQTFANPFLFLFILGLILFSTLFHEFGHAAGSYAGGAKPGRIGAGLYIIWPAFFTDISEIYRLKRTARLRGDIGGIYFNLVFSIVLGVGYFVTGFEPLLLVIALQNISILNQSLPFVRLDGYFILSDLVGLPDLFLRIKPILKNMLLRQKNAATADIKPWIKWTVSLWVLITIPAMTILLLIMLWQSPQIFFLALTSAMNQFSVIMQTYAEKNYFTMAVQMLQMLILILPGLGVGMLLFILLKQTHNLIRHIQQMQPYTARKSLHKS